MLSTSKIDLSLFCMDDARLAHILIADCMGMTDLAKGSYQTAADDFGGWDDWIDTIAEISDTERVDLAPVLQALSSQWARLVFASPFDY